MLEQAQEIIKFHKEKCFKCGSLVEKGENGIFRCPDCNFEWANLFIKRIPVQPFLNFKKYADDNFCSDYGMAFKSLMEEYDGIFNLLAEHENRLNKLENKPSKEIKTLSGKIIKKEE